MWSPRAAASTTPCWPAPPGSAINWDRSVPCTPASSKVITRARMRRSSPASLRAEPRLGPVVGRLHAEHVVIAGLLQELDEALVTLMGAPEGDAVSAERIQAIAEVLSDLLLSHLGYEEDQLADGLRLLSEAT